MKRTLLFSVLLLAQLSCSKEHVTQQPRLVALASTQDDDGLSGCYRTYSETLEHPPADYIPGQAEIDLTACFNDYIHRNMQLGNNIKQFPPPPPTPDTHIPPPPTSAGQNDEYLDLFGLPHLSSRRPNPNLPTPEFLTALATFQRFGGIVCDALSATTFPTGTTPSNIDKKAAILGYIVFHPELFASADEQRLFSDFLVMVFEGPVFRITIGPGAGAYTDFPLIAISSFPTNDGTLVGMSAIAKCINLSVVYVP